MFDDFLIKKALLKHNQKLLEDNDSHSWCSPSTNPSQHSFDRFDKYNFIFLILGMNKSDTTTQVKVDVTFDYIHNTELAIKIESTFPPFHNCNTVKIHIMSMAHCLLT